jgi:hypothetical protein
MFVSAKTASPTVAPWLRLRPGRATRPASRGTLLPAVQRPLAVTQCASPPKGPRDLSTDHWLGLGVGIHGPHPMVACGLFDGLAHEPWRHGVQPVRVVIPG